MCLSYYPKNINIIKSLNDLQRRKMLKIILLCGAFDIILCEIQGQTKSGAISQVSSCKNPPLCYLSDMYKTESKSISFLPYANSPNYGRQQSNLERSYHNGFGLSASPTYYP